MLRYFFREDIFISYTRADAVNYAANLANQLSGKDYTCFLDQWGTPPGREFPLPLKRALRRSTTFVLIGTQQASVSASVGLEVAEFLKTNRTLIPIDFEGAIEKAPWYPLISGLARTPESHIALAEGKPSAQVMRRIEDSFNFTRRNLRVRRTFTIIGILLFILLCTSIYSVIEARNQLRKTNIAKAAADSAALEAKRQETLALENKNKFLAEEKIAKENARKATQQEALALQNAEQAKEQQQLAETRMKIAFSGELAMNANTQLEEDPELSVLLSREAVQVTPSPTALAEEALRRSLNASRLRMTLPGHGDVVRYALFSPGDKYVLTTSNDRTARIWNAVTGRLISKHSWMARDLNSSVFSPTGKLLATPDGEGNVDIWEAETGRTVSRLEKDFFEELVSAAFSPNGLLVATGGQHATVWNPLTGKKIITLKTAGGQNTSYVCFSPDSKYLFASYQFLNDGSIWELGTGNRIVDLKTDDQVSGAEFSPDGKFILTFSSPSNNAKVWDSFTGKLVVILEGHSDWVNSASFSPDSKCVVTSSSDGTARIWDISTGNIIASMLGHSNGVNEACFSPDGKTVITAGKDGTVRLWEKSGKSITIFRGHRGSVASAQFSLDGHSVLTASADGTAKIWDAAADETKRISLPAKGAVFSLDFSPDSRFVVSASEDNMARVWEIAIKKLVWEFKHEGAVKTAQYSANGKMILTTEDNRNGPSSWYVWDLQSGKLLRKSPFGVSGIVKFSPDSKSVLSAGPDLRIMDIATGHWKVSIPMFESFEHVTFSPDGKYFVTTSDTIARVWLAANGRLVSTLNGHTYNVTDRAYRWDIHAFFSKDSRYLITSGTDNKACVWAVASGRRIMVLKGHNGIIADADFSNDGRMIATCGDDGTVKIWDRFTSRILKDIKAHKNGIGQVQFSPDGRFIATSSYWDGAVGVWSTSTGGRVDLLNGLLRGSAFSPNGRFIATAGDGANIYLCESCVTIKELLALSAIRITRTLTTDECKQYLRGEQCK